MPGVEDDKVPVTLQTRASEVLESRVVAQVFPPSLRPRADRGEESDDLDPMPCRQREEFMKEVQIRRIGTRGAG